VSEKVRSDDKKEIASTDALIPTYDFNEFESTLHQNDDKVHVINFWATWCKPCIAELPYFDRINKEYADRDIKVTLVSLDFPNQIESRLIPFIKKKDIKAEVVFLDDPKGNSWIPKVDESWSGAIPATVFYKNGKRKFFERSFTYEELSAELDKFINSTKNKD
tara:strand:- start:800 stop:1288 length:489 start_codon:yes stop_codon:yes gene_type:complete